ncbi:hypothetical protein KFE98_20010 [bacterium SCSIO 12741]|nr:hypothetical protein KFE98_20010 [bacterium SCSIO 12741]
MKESQTIPAKVDKELIFDYRKLRQMAISFTQKFSSDIWTDYNEHDPGVTILESLCYAVTDMAYRTQYPVEDILVSTPGEKLKAGDNAFYPPDEIYPVNPVNNQDLRKYLIDALNEVNNAWVEKGKNLGEKNVWLLLNDSVPVGYEKRVKSKARKSYNLVRNLSESLGKVEVLPRKEVGVSCQIHINENTRAELVMAHFLYRIERFFNPSPRFYSAAEMLAKGYSKESLYSGPVMKHGHIIDSELQPFRDEFDLSDLIKRLINVEGVKSIHDFKLFLDGQPITGVFKSPNFVPKLRDYEMFTSQKSGVQFLVKNVPIVLNNNLVKEGLNRIRAQRNRSYQIESQKTGKDLPQGQYRDVSNYYSFQNDFPTIYNIGSFGMGPDASLSTRSAAHQLKAYLMFYDQIFANFLKQTSELKKLFSIEDVDQSNYFQAPEEVPRFWEVLKNEDAPEVHSTAAKRQQAKEWLDQELEKIRSQFDDFGQRRNAFLDNLLARFGESFREYSLSKFNYYYTPEKFEKVMIRYKTAFLREYVSLSRNRARGIDLNKNSWDTNNVAGIHERLCRLLLIQNHKNRSLVDVVDKSGFSLFQVRTEVDTMNTETWDGELLEDDSTHIEIINVEAMWSEDFQLDPNAERMLFTSPSPDVLNQVLFNGVDRTNYRIFRDPLENNRFDLLLQLKEKGRWLKLKQCESRAKARQLRQRLIQFLIQVSVKSEGLFLVEHILLKPELEVVQSTTGPEEGQSGTPDPVTPKKVPSSNVDPEDPFFYGQLSFVFPSWPARFQNESFRSLVMETVQSLVPAHLLARCYWLDLEMMRDFEKDYEQWAQALHGGPANETLNVLSERIMNYLKSFSQQRGSNTIVKSAGGNT